MKDKQKQDEWFYMHTISGIPAQYIPNQQIVYADGTRGNAGVRRLATSLKQIKSEWRLSNSWRRSRHLGKSMDYGYVRISRATLKP